MKTISIVTPSFNQGEYLRETLESVRAQHDPSVEHLVIDGGSTDSTLSKLRASTGPAWRHLNWVSEVDGGCTQGLNKGIRFATGDIIGWLNSDDRYRPGCLAAVRKAFEEYPEADVIYGDFTFMDADGGHRRVRREIEFSELVLFYHRICPIPSTATFFRRRIFDEGEFFDESLQFGMDVEFFVRLANKGYRFQHIHALLADFRLHSGSKTIHSGARQLAETRETMCKYSPVARRVANPQLRSLCLRTMRIAAAVARYSEKLFRGYYLPDRFLKQDRFHRRELREPSVEPRKAMTYK